jgi:PAS domain-containing protein
MTEGSNYLDQPEQIIGDERVDPVATAAGIRQVIAGERELFSYPHCHDTAAGERWALATVTRLRGDAPGGALVSHEDLTAARRGEQLLRLEYTVARALAAAGNIATALQAVIRAVCEVQRWERGRYLRLDAVGVLVLEESWGEPEAALERLRQAPRRAVSAPGPGLADRACQSRRPHWVLDATRDPQAAQTALAHETDLGGAFVFPVLAGKQSLGVLAFANRTVRAPDEPLLQAVRSIGEQVGQFLLRRGSDDATRRSEACFRSLLDISVDWYWEQDEHFRYTSLTGAGMACIQGIVGKTLWELPGIVLGADEWIKHKSELAAQWSFCDLECAVAGADGQRDYYRISGAPVYSEAGVFTGFHGTGLDITHSRRAGSPRGIDPEGAGR